MVIKNRIHSEKTLLNWKKEDLVAHCIALEHNVNVMVERFEEQYQTYVNMINGTVPRESKDG